MPSDEYEVLICGAGPTGMMLAAELALAGVDVAIVERRTNTDVHGSRAGGLNPRSLELLDQRGIADRFISKGKKHSVLPFAGAFLDISDLPTRHNYMLALWQAEIERELSNWLGELSVPVQRRFEVVTLSADDEGVAVKSEDGRTVRAAYLVGCDGGRSTVRRLTGIEFPGWDPSVSYLIFECDAGQTPPSGARYGLTGISAVTRLEDGRIRGVVAERHVRGGQPNAAELHEALLSAFQSDLGVRNVTWLSRFTDAARQASEYRRGRVLLAGDAAHIHSPVGGQGLNLGLQDAVNLGWKLAQVVKGRSPESLLDTYCSERHPVGAAVLKQTLALTALSRGDERTAALRELLVATMRLNQPRLWYCSLMCGLDVCYECSEEHPLVGRRFPDIDLEMNGKRLRAYELLHDARALLIKDGDFNEPGWCFKRDERLRVVEARSLGTWELPSIGAIEFPSAILIRPDGHVAWAGDAPSTELDRTLEFYGLRSP